MKSKMSKLCRIGLSMMHDYDSPSLEDACWKYAEN